MEEDLNSIVFELYKVRIENFSLLLCILQNTRFTRFHPIKNDYCTVITFLIRISLLEQLAKEGRMGGRTRRHVHIYKFELYK